MAKTLIFEGELEFHSESADGNAHVIVGSDNLTTALARYVQCDLNDADVVDPTDADGFGDVRVTVEFL